ncbi:Rossmann-fold NAD(P)-binding domain-containing protein [Streptomyces sasae]|uniref:hypothetical protein n=1 Tax=Streptomyces sasae TaxID=1266772 RepID=UPI0029317D01|nr:hypothetical protein [Streptomyces sasae]
MTGMNGGSRSVVDGRVPAWCPARDDDTVAALRRYDEMRRPAVNAIVLGNREPGPEAITARAAEHGGPLPHGEAERIPHRYKELAGATATQVNDHPSWSRPTPGERGTDLDRSA